MKSILVTGGAGYIGSHTSKTLGLAGYQPIAYDNLTTGHRWAVQWGPLVEGDLSDRELLARTLDRYRVEGVIHLAASAEVGESMKTPVKYFRNNVIHSLNLLQAMLEARIDKIVFSSSCAVYGVPRRVPISEAQHTRPANPYGETKLFIERALSWYGSIHGLRWVALRYFNAAGADAQHEIGESHDPETHLIPLAIQAAMRRIPELTIYGTDYPTPDGTAVRDYIHVSDLADAHVRALRYLQRGPSRAFNLGTGIGHSVKQVIESVERVSGCHAPACNAARRQGDPPVLVARADLARRAIGWTPEYTDLDAIVRTAWKWHCNQSQRQF